MLCVGVCCIFTQSSARIKAPGNSIEGQLVVNGFQELISLQPQVIQSVKVSLQSRLISSGGWLESGMSHLKVLDRALHIKLFEQLQLLECVQTLVWKGFCNEPKTWWILWSHSVACSFDFLSLIRFVFVSGRVEGFSSGDVSQTCWFLI